MHNDINQVASVVVDTYCVIDAIIEKVNHKYAKIQMALDIFLLGISAICFTWMLGLIHEENILTMVHSMHDSESKFHQANVLSNVKIVVDSFLNFLFELMVKDIATENKVASTMVVQSAIELKKELKTHSLQVSLF